MNDTQVEHARSMRGKDLISQMLAAEGVNTVFGIPDTGIYPLWQTLEEAGMRLISPTHESCAMHMAGAYAKLKAETGVCLVGKGPGMATALSGIAVENAEGHRVLLISTAPEGGGNPRFPQTQVSSPITKWSDTVPGIEKLGEFLSKAFRLSYTGKPGVVHLNIPEHLLEMQVPPEAAYILEPSTYRAVEPMAPLPEQVSEAVDMLNNARFPIIHAGTGVLHANAENELMELAVLMEAPVSSSWGGRSAMDERSDLSIPMIYLSATNNLRNKADVVLALGSRIGETDWWGKPPYWAPPAKQKLIQVDLDADVFGFNKPVDLAIQSDVKVFMREVIKVLRNQKSDAHLENRKRLTQSFRKECMDRRSQLSKHLLDESVPMASAHVPCVCQEVFDEKAVVVIDGGNTSIWGLFFHEVRHPNTIIGTPKMGHLGAGVSQALGAKAALPERTVYCITGDGAMGFHQQDIETAVRYNLPVIYLVLCDKQWGMVKMNQLFTLKPLKTLVLKTLSPEESINTDIGETAFDKLAMAMGAYGERVSDPKQLKGALDRAVQSGKCAVIHVDVDPVKHMWAPNLKDFKDLHMEPAG